MTQASVGFHCPECAREGSQRVLTGAALQFRPVVTQVLIALSVVGFVWGAAVGGELLGLGTKAVADGGLFAVKVDPSTGGFVGVDEGDWWRIVTHGFLHAGLLHIGLNMAALWILGSQLERVLGRVRFAGVYFVSLLAGAFGILLVDPNAATVGASGAVFGLMGAALMVQRAAGIDPWASGVGGLILVNLLITFTVPFISIGGHVGGLIGGVIVGGFTVEGIRRRWPLAVSVVVMVALAALFSAGSLWAASRWLDPVL